MKPLLCSLFLVFSFVACKNRQSSSGALSTTGISDSLAQKAQGTYTGQFSKGLITVVINYISGRTVSGFDVHKGLRRNINGLVTQQGNLLNFVLKEPGGNPYDGIFTFALDTTSWAIKGKWTPMDTTKASSRKLALSRKNQTSLDGRFDYTGTWSAGRDSTLMLEDDGTCSFAFYEKPDDSTSQVITLKGNYMIKGHECMIEWQKNNHFPSMKLNITPITRDADSNIVDMPQLQGNGLVFSYYEGD